MNNVRRSSHYEERASSPDALECWLDCLEAPLLYDLDEFLNLETYEEEVSSFYENVISDVLAERNTQGDCVTTHCRQV